MSENRKSYLSVLALLLAGVLLAACGGTALPTTQPPAATATVGPEDAGTGAAQKAADALAAQLDLDPLDIAVIGVEATQWPDGCLGIQLPGQACAMHVVDGYKVVLEAQDHTYEYRTNADGSMALPAQALTWHREGGVAGFCDDLVIDQTGVAVAWSCAGGLPEEAGRATLNAEQAQQLQTWLASLSPFEVNQTDKATADAMTIRMSFDGRGGSTAGDAEKQAIEGFAAELYAQISQGQSGSLGDPAQVVSGFLTALQSDPSGQSSLAYLSQDLQAKVQSGEPVSQLLGVESAFRSFGVSGTHVENGSKYALVEVGLNVVSPLKRAFELVRENGSWVIDTFVIYGVPALSVPADVASADQVVLDYIHALHDKNAAAAWMLLGPTAQSALSETDLDAMVQAADQISSVYLNLTKVSPDQLVYTANLWVTPNPNQPGDWLVGANTRTFTLTKTSDGWLIAQIVKSDSQS
ncbi:MAG: hypothetical protein ACK2UU_04400 [Anaerolineae bacterium]|jgi:hypothetical protein